MNIEARKEKMKLAVTINEGMKIKEKKRFLYNFSIKIMQLDIGASKLLILNIFLARKIRREKIKILHVQIRLYYEVVELSKKNRSLRYSESTCRTQFYE